MQALQRPGIYEGLESTAQQLANGLQDVFRVSRTPLSINRVGSMMTLFFKREAVTGWGSASNSDKKGFASFFHKMLEKGVYLPPSPFEAMFVSTSHSDQEIQTTIKAAAEVISQN